MNSLEAITATILAITSIIGACALGVKWLVKHYLYELKPNGGSSLRDSVNANSERLLRLEDRVDKIYDILCEQKSR
jgi:hypothetical protein